MKCVAKNCGNRATPRVEGVSFHSMPLDAILKTEWCSALGIKIPLGKRDRVCSLHFDKRDFIYLAGKVYLRPNAVPTQSLAIIPPQESKCVSGSEPKKTSRFNKMITYTSGTDVQRASKENIDINRPYEFKCVSGSEPETSCFHQMLPSTSGTNVQRTCEENIDIILPHESTCVSGSEPETSCFHQMLPSTSGTNVQRTCEELKPVELNAFVPKRARLEFDEAHDVQSPIEAISIASYEAVSNRPKTNPIMNYISIRLNDSKDVGNGGIQKRYQLFSCPECKEIFKSGTQLESHFHSAHGKTLYYTLRLDDKNCNPKAPKHVSNVQIPKSILKYKCLECARTYESPADLELHLRLHEPYKCIICPKTFRTMYHLREHIVLGHDHNYKSNLGWCPICSFPACKETLVQHMVGHVRIVRFSCRVCRKTPTTRKLFWKHIFRAHNDLAPSKIIEKLQCTCCGKIFRTEKGLMKHKSRKEFNANQYRCNFCHEIFRRETTVQNHINVAHSKAMQLRPCQFCGEEIPSYNIEHHFKSHTNRWFCDSCDLQCDQQCEVVKAASAETKIQEDPPIQQSKIELQVLNNGLKLVPQEDVEEFIVHTDGTIMINQNEDGDPKGSLVCGPGVNEENFDVSVEDIEVEEIDEPIK